MDEWTAAGVGPPTPRGEPMNPFQQIPNAVRKWIYLTYATVGLILGGLQVYGTEQVGALDVSQCLEVLAYVGVALGFTAASNLPSYQDVAEGDAEPPAVRGEAGYSWPMVAVGLAAAAVFVYLLFFVILPALVR